MISFAMTRTGMEFCLSGLVGSAGGGLDVVRRLSEQTHGVFTPIYSAASYQVALDRLAERLASEMMVEYIVPPRSAATDIQVGVRIPGARVRGLGVRPQ